MDYQPLKYIYKASGNPEAYTMLLLHGTGGNENDLLDLGKSFGSDLNLLSVRGNVSEHGMPRFLSVWVWVYLTSRTLHSGQMSYSIF